MRVLRIHFTGRFRRGLTKIYVKRLGYGGWTLHFGRLNGRWSSGLDRYEPRRKTSRRVR